MAGVTEPRSVLAVAAHPDDIEFVMSGTMMRLADAGYALHYINLADGSCGSVEMDGRRTAEVREHESRRAAAMLGAKFYPSLTRDLEIFYERSLLVRLASIVRQAAPTIMLVHSPDDYMEDHMNACRLAVTAAFSRGMPNFPVEPPADPLDQPVTLYHAQPHGNQDMLGRPVRPDYFVDVEDLMGRKAELLRCHASQSDWLDRSQGLGSYVDAMRDLMREVGQWSGHFDWAEGWRRHSHLGFCDPAADPLRDALGDHLFRAD